MKSVIRLAFLVASVARALTHESRATPDICHGDLCYPSVFEASDDFAVVREDQSVPAGLNVRINMATGLKEAKLMTVDEQHAHQPETEVAVIDSEGSIKKQPVVAQQKTRPYRPSSYLQGTDIAIFMDAMNVLREETSCTPEVEGALDSLEDLVHELEFGLRLVDPNKSQGLELVSSLMKNGAPSCRSKAALVIGSALRNNENALDCIPKSHKITTQLLESISHESEQTVMKMQVYALSATMSLPSARHDYRVADGHQVLRKAYAAGSDELQGKISSFVEDHYAQFPTLGVDVVLQDDATYEQQIYELDAIESWCKAFQGSLLAGLSSMTAHEKMLSAVSQIKRTNPEACHAPKEFLEYLASASVSKEGTSSDAVVAMARSARSLFGNIKASRKHEAEYL